MYCKLTDDALPTPNEQTGAPRLDPVAAQFLVATPARTDIPGDDDGWFARRMSTMRDVIVGDRPD